MTNPQITVTTNPPNLVQVIDGSISVSGGGAGSIGPTGPTGAQGVTGPVGSYVVSINGLTGVVTGAASTNTSNTFIPLQTFVGGISASGGLTLNGTLNLNGVTYNANIARTDVINVFTKSQIIESGNPFLSVLDSKTQNSVALSPTALEIYFTNVGDDESTIIRAQPTNGESIVVSLPNQNTILAGTDIDQTFDGVNNFTNTTNLSGGANVTGQITLNGQGFGNVVSRFNGLCGPVNIAPGTDINITQSGNTFTINSTAAISGVCSYVAAFNGLTGAVGISAGANITIIPSGNTFIIESLAEIASITQYVATFNGLTGNVTGVTTSNANTFIPLQTFTVGISSAGGTFSELTHFNRGLSASGICLGSSTILTPTRLRSTSGFTFRSSTLDTGLTFNELRIPVPSSGDNGNITFVSRSGIVNLDATPITGMFGDSYKTGLKFFGLQDLGGFPQNYSTTLESGIGVGNTCTLPTQSGTLALTNDVVSRFNGLTGNVTGVTVGGLNTFTRLQTFAAGISTSGITAVNATFSSDIRVNNIAIGRGGGNLTSNTRVGISALGANTSGSNNTAFGASALFGNTGGAHNTAIGRFALRFVEDGNQNTAVGSNALQSLTIGNQNIGIGASAGFALLDNTGGIYIGSLSVGTEASTNEIVIGTEAVGLGSNTAVIGATTQTSATIYGTLNSTNGISTSGQINLNGQTFTNVVSALNGLTGIVGLSAGDNVTITVSGNTLIIGASGSSSSSTPGPTGAYGLNAGTIWEFADRINNCQNNVTSITAGTFTIITCTACSPCPTCLNSNAFECGGYLALSINEYFGETVADYLNAWDDVGASPLGYLHIRHYTTAEQYYAILSLDGPAVNVSTAYSDGYFAFPYSVIAGSSGPTVGKKYSMTFNWFCTST